MDCLPVTPVAAGVYGTGALTAELAAASGKTTYIEGFDITIAAGGNASVNPVDATVTGLTIGTLHYAVTNEPSTPLLTILSIRYPRPLAASALDTVIDVNVPSFGTNSPQVGISAYGFQL